MIFIKYNRGFSMISSWKSTCFCMPVAVFLCLPVMALATVPDTGTILREQKQAQPPLPERLPKPEEMTEHPAVKGTSVKVLVKGFRFTGIEGIATDSELQILVANAIGKELTISELQAIAGTVTNYLREKGFMLAKAYLPKQEISDGIVEIAVIAGRIEGRTNIRVKQPRRIHGNVLKDMADSGVHNGEVVSSKNLERSVMLLNDIPGITAHATLEKGSSPGTTKVVIDAEEGPLISGSITGDNFGDRYTGLWRGTGQATVNDALGIGDQLSFVLTGAENLFQGRVGYSLPIGSGGLRGNLSYTGLYYELGGDLKSLNASGRADTIAAGASYPFLRSRNVSMWGGLSYEYRLLTDDYLGVKSRDREIHSGTADLSATLYDGFNGGGLTSIRLAIGTGDVDLSGVAADAAADAATAKTAGSYFKFDYTVARLQRLTDAFTLYAAINGQLAGSNLDSSEKIIVGGPNGIRSYPVGEGNGDEGHTITTELRYDIPLRSAIGTVQLASFFDTGIVTLHKDPWPNSVNTATGKNDYWLSGAGLGVNMAKTGYYSLRTSWAHTIDDNPGRSTTGKNADNLSEDDRFWIYGVFWF